MANELQKTNTGIALFSAQEIAELIDENLGGRLDASALDSVKMPAGGGTTWSVPTIDGDVDQKVLEGVIIHMSYQNAYWPVGLDESGGGTPPDCVSRDSIFGVGTPGGDCGKCPLNQFKSKGAGKACKNTMTLFLTQPDNILPIKVVLPPTSIGETKKYLQRLTGLGAGHYKVISMLTLVKTKNDAGIAYSEVDIKAKVINPGGATKREKIMLDEATIRGIEEYRAAIKPALIRLQTEAADYMEAETADN